LDTKKIAKFLETDANLVPPRFLQASERQKMPWREAYKTSTKHPNTMAQSIALS
jgi:hypothetical protein